TRACVTFRSQSSSWPSTARYRNRSADLAWFCVEAETLPPHCQITQELFDLSATHTARMPLVEMQNEAPRPIDICILGPDGVMFCPNACSQLIAQLWRVEIGRQASGPRGGGEVTGVFLGNVRGRLWRHFMAKQGVETRPNRLRASLSRLSFVTFGTATLS